MGVGESHRRKCWLNRGRSVRGDEIKSKRRMMRRFGRDKQLTPWQRSFAAIVCIRTRTAFASFAALGSFLREFAAIQAVKRLH